jgi:hypothetical protein
MADALYLSLWFPDFSGPAMLPMSELEYGGVTEKMGQLDERFLVRKGEEHGATGNGGNGRKKKAA